MPYTTSALVKLSLGITDTARDDLVDAAVAAASSQIDRHCGRTFEQADTASERTFRTRGRVVPDCDGEMLLVPDISTDDDLVVKVGDIEFSELDSTQYELEPEDAFDRGRPATRVRYRYGFWRYSRRVRITAKWGWAEVPADIQQAALLQAARLYRRKDSPEGVAGSADWGLVRVPNLDPDVRALLDDFVLPGF